LGFAIIATALTGCSTTEIIISQGFGTLLATKETRGSAAVKADDATSQIIEPGVEGHAGVSPDGAGEDLS
jgi:hypothetical protein